MCGLEIRAGCDPDWQLKPCGSFHHCGFEMYTNLTINYVNPNMSKTIWLGTLEMPHPTLTCAVISKVSEIHCSITKGVKQFILPKVVVGRYGSLEYLLGLTTGYRVFNEPSCLVCFFFLNCSYNMLKTWFYSL